MQDLQWGGCTSLMFTGSDLQPHLAHRRPFLLPSQERDINMIMTPSDDKDIVQRCMLNARHLEQLEKDTGVKPWTFEQHEFEAVIIPAGCPHQVRCAYYLLTSMSCAPDAALVQACNSSHVVAAHRIETPTALWVPSAVSSLSMLMPQIVRAALLADAALSSRFVTPYHGSQFGGPMQVRNLKGCLKVAIDFVAPESIGQCLRLSEERRLLAMQEKGPVEKRVHADKLQGELMLNRALADCTNVLNKM